MTQQKHSGEFGEHIVHTTYYKYIFEFDVPKPSYKQTFLIDEEYDGIRMRRTKKCSLLSEILELKNPSKSSFFQFIHFVRMIEFIDRKRDLFF